MTHLSADHDDLQGYLAVFRFTKDREMAIGLSSISSVSVRRLTDSPNFCDVEIWQESFKPQLVQNLPIDDARQLIADWASWERRFQGEGSHELDAEVRKLRLKVRDLEAQVDALINTDDEARNVKLGLDRILHMFEACKAEKGRTSPK